MTHLYIELNTGLTEEVNSSIISKLYELAISGDLDNTSDLKGRLHSEYAHRFHTEYLNATYPDLYISIDNYTIPFEDPNMITYLNSIGVGSNGMVTEAQAAAATVVANSANTTVTKFNELKYFTNITTSKNGYTAGNSGVISFAGWTALEEVDISNFTSIGHKTSAAWEDTFKDCTSLKTVTASENLDIIGTNCFSGCTNLETILGLSGNILVNDSSFNNCHKLAANTFNNVTFSVELNRGSNCFTGCNLIASLALDGLITSMPSQFFRECSALQSITGLNNVTTIQHNAFRSCSSLSSTDIDWSKITLIAYEAFVGCSSLLIDDLQIPNLTSLGNTAFDGCAAIKKVSDLGSVTLIGSNCFYRCSQLTQITLPVTCTSIGNTAFKLCNNLTSINFGGTQYIGEGAFSRTGFTSITIPEGVKAIKRQCFDENGSTLTSITIPSTLTQVWSDNSDIVYENTNLVYLDLRSGSALLNVTISPTVTCLELLLFSTDQRNVNITIPDSVKYINNMIYDDANVGTGCITFGNNSNLEFMGHWRHYNAYKNFDFTTTHSKSEWEELDNVSSDSCEFNIRFTNFPKDNIKYIPRLFLSSAVKQGKNNVMDIIGNNVVGIGRSAFYSNTFNDVNYDIILPASLKYIGKCAFGLLRATSYVFKSTTPPIVSHNGKTEDVFGIQDNYFSANRRLEMFRNCPIYVPSSALLAYKDLWPELSDYIFANPNE